MNAMNIVALIGKIRYNRQKKLAAVAWQIWQELINTILMHSHQQLLSNPL